MFKLNNLKIPHDSPFHPTDNLEAFDDVLRATDYSWRISKESNAKARQLYEKAIQLDPEYADAYASLGWNYSVAAWFEWTKNPPFDLKRADALAQKALALDDSNLPALALLTRDDWLEARPDQAVADGKLAVALNPNYAQGYFELGQALLRDGKPEQAIDKIHKAIRLDPESEDFYAVVIAAADLDLERFQAAAPLYERYVAAYPNDLVGHLGLCVAYVELGRAADARTQAAEAMRLNPQFKLSVLWKSVTKKEWVALQRELGDLRKVGLK